LATRGENESDGEGCCDAIGADSPSPPGSVQPVTVV